MEPNNFGDFFSIPLETNKNETWFSKQPNSLQLLLSRSSNLIFLTNSSTQTNLQPQLCFCIHFAWKTPNFCNSIQTSVLKSSWWQASNWESTVDYCRWHRLLCPSFNLRTDQYERVVHRCAQCYQRTNVTILTREICYNVVLTAWHGPIQGLIEELSWWRAFWTAHPASSFSLRNNIHFMQAVHTAQNA